MATIQVVLANGTTADANDVMANFTEIYTDIDETNVGVANKTGSGKFVLQTSPSIASPTVTGVSGFADGSVSAPSITFSSDTNTGIYRKSTDVLSIACGGGNPTDFDSSGIFIQTTGSFSTPSIRLNNANTGFYLANTNQIGMSCGGTLVFSLSSSTIEVRGSTDFAVQATRKIFVDGGSNTSMRESAADTLAFETGGSDRLTLSTSLLTSTVPLLLPDVDPPTANSANRNGIAKAWAQISVEMGAGITDAPTPTVIASYNVSSVTGSSGTPRITINWNTDFSSSNYVFCTASNNVTGGQQWQEYNSSPKTASSLTLVPSGFSTSTTYTVYVMAIGDQ